MYKLYIRLLLLASLCLLAETAGAVPALVTRCPNTATFNGGNNAGTTVTCIFPSNTAGNMLFIAGYVDVNSSALTISDTAGNTWTTVLADSNGTCSGSAACTTHAWVAYNNKVSAGNNTVTMTSSITAVNSIYTGGAEYSGLATAAALDQTVSATGTSTTPNSGNVTTTVASELFIGLITGGDGSATLSAGTNVAWTLEQSTTNGNRSLGWEDFIASATQTVSANATYSASVGWRATIFTFKVPGGGGGASKKKKIIFYFRPLLALLSRGGAKG